MTVKSVVEARDIGLAIEMIDLGARMQMLESEVKLSRERLLKLYKEVKKESPPKGMLPFSADLFVPVVLADDPVAARLDELAALPWVKNSPIHADTVKLNIHGFPAGHIPAWTVDAYRSRLQVLDGHTPFNLTYNPIVQSFIDLYAVRKREMTSRMLGLADLYFPVFEEYLDKHHMPLELKYLAVVESALNPSARSRAGAVGLWQFMLPTGKMFGLKATSYVDERHDVYLSTEAACKYLKYLYGLYDNWEMALAAYNCGPGNVNKAIRRSGVPPLTMTPPPELGQRATPRKSNLNVPRVQRGNYTGPVDGNAPSFPA